MTTPDDPAAGPGSAGGLSLHDVLTPLCRGRWCARPAACAADIAAAQALRGRAFHGPGQPPDRDAFDARCAHVLVEEAATGALAGCFRMLSLPGGVASGPSYAAQFYDLAPLRGLVGPAVELGRFCIDPARRDPDILRVAWGAMTACVDRLGVELLFGCASFPGTDAAPYADAFAVLHAAHRAPRDRAPGVRAAEVVRLGPTPSAPDPRAALRAMPPLLRTYLGMGGWVSDHAVVDRAMNTLHVFTGVEIAAIPEARKRLLRAVAG